ncbi:MAG: ATP-binding protein, partial [Ktedonobacterales bacterium]
AIDSAQAHEASEQARAAAEASSIELETILNSMPDAVVVFDAQGRITHRNSAALALYGATAAPNWTSQVIRERVAGFALYTREGHRLADDEWPALRVLRGEVFTDDSAPDVYYRDRDGRDIWLNATGVPLHNAQGAITGAVIVYRDVTRRRQLEARTSETLSALLAMAAMLVELPHDHSAAEAFSEATVTPASAPPVDHLASGAQATDDANSIDAAMTDEQQAPENAIAQRLAALTCGVLGCTRVGIIAVEPQTEHLRATAVVGLPPDQERQWWAEQRALEAQGIRLGDGGDPAELARFRAGEVLIIDMTKPPLNELPNPYGITTSLAAPMRIGDQVVGLLSLDYGGPPHDFTADEVALAGAVAQLGAVVLERERLLRERAQAQAQALALQEANRRMDEFLGVAGHELRTPLTTIKSNVQLASRRINRILGDLTAITNDATNDATSHAIIAKTLTTLTTLSQMLTRTVEAELRQERLVTDLLDVSRIEEGRLELRIAPVALNALTQECIVEQQVNAPDRVITLKTPAHETFVLGDADRVRQVITNFLTNALKYSPAEQPVQVSVRVNAHQAQVRVRDFGPGLPPEAQVDIWERFHRAPGVEVMSGSGVGLGLGLYISKTIITLHGGHVGVESAPGKGSTFWCALPLATPSH